MQRILLLGLGLVLCAPLLLAQEEKAMPQNGMSYGQARIVILHPDGTRTATTVSRPVTPLCPVGMQARQGSGSGLIAVRDGHDGPARNSGPSQRIHLVLMSGRAAQVIGAKVRVRGLSGRNRMERADGINGITPDRTMTLNATFTPENNAEVAADLVLAGFTSVETIDLLSISYKDGSTWKMESRNACRVAPDPMMLVADK